MTLLVQVTPIIFLYFKFLKFYINGLVTYLLVLLLLPLKVCFANRNMGQFFVVCIFDFIHFCFRLLRISFNCCKDQSYRIFVSFACFADPGLPKIRQLSTSCHRGLNR